jgi:hypothetical protein
VCVSIGAVRRCALICLSQPSHHGRRPVSGERCAAASRRRTLTVECGYGEMMPIPTGRAEVAWRSCGRSATGRAAIHLLFASTTKHQRPWGRKCLRPCGERGRCAERGHALARHPTRIITVRALIVHVSIAFVHLHLRGLAAPRSLLRSAHGFRFGLVLFTEAVRHSPP